MTDQNEDSNDQLPDHAGVAFHPPVMLILMLVVGFGLRMALPLSFLPGEMVWIAGLTIVVSAFAFFFWAVFTMRQGGGSIPTGKPTDVILSNGPYGFSRNPIYASMIVLLIGVGIWANSLWFIGFAVIAVFLLSWGVISREEAYLERKFTRDYAAYKSAVRRWL